MLQITEKEVQDSITMDMALPVLRKAYEDCMEEKIYAGGRIFMPVRGQENVGQWLVANCTNKPYFGSKFSSVFPENLKKGLPSVISKVSLYSAVTGELHALIDANYLTAIKTGGSAAIATDLMAKKDANKLGIIGSGLQAFSQVLAIQEVRNITELYVYDVIPERVDRFINQIETIKNNPYKITAATTADECVAQTDIICTCTTSLTPVFKGSSVKPGTHINAIGSFTSFMQEIDEETVLKSDKVITEHVEGLWDSAGDIIIPFEKGLISKDKVNGTVGDVLTGKILGRENDQEITLYESVGSGVLDIALSIAIYEKFKK
ncbi:ornithine cyclodeaminase family protein [Schinkia azotoformans]|uniref:ornithine cyclodeaminase family protein n=1 Tax=Schinkia azotoformans TaxID=1454 RepID=UPI002DBAA9AD|nr:ornithine cyclodeaminase family protein [Schinkia azotoformans]MEC1715125.1 ornithine cyclodeaminase family protein [Schinkia azotoformans]MEC1739825.1 ornithine cyclodeaminase family protein [Schinkia azotoformans]MEC1745550.1 ornithine cyclodeaminase family protein [Schinkia azotoformans]MEC1765050.1 ornithine cyclodeaminase family protein [Schinkia azotoformans]MEC1788567.1 ornithine cyclodeaminase family protein [Schinkia azotoformans]